MMHCIGLDQSVIKIETNGATNGHKYQIYSIKHQNNQNKHQCDMRRGGNKDRCCVQSRIGVVDACSCANVVPLRNARSMICSRCKILKISTILTFG